MLIAFIQIFYLNNTSLKLLTTLTADSTRRIKLLYNQQVKAKLERTAVKLVITKNKQTNTTHILDQISIKRPLLEISLERLLSQDLKRKKSEQKNVEKIKYFFFPLF